MGGAVGSAAYLLAVSEADAIDRIVDFLIP